MKIVLTGGGTMGHITPLLNFKEELEKTGEHQFYYLGNIHKVEKGVADENNIPFYHVRSLGTGGLGKLSKKIEFATDNLLGVMDASKILKTIKPDFIISTGGFVTAPVLGAAQVLRVPYFIHEQNRVLGKVNKLFLLNAKEIYYTFEQTLGGQTKRQGQTMGNPVKNFDLASGGEKTLFLGGSGGSEFINKIGVEYALKNPEQSIILQTGQKRYEDVEKIVNDKGIKNIELIAFSDMKTMLEQAKTVISRAGSSTVCELIENEKPALVIPFKLAADNHQVENARYLVENKMGWMAFEDDSLEEVLTKIEILQDENQIEKAKDSMKQNKKRKVAQNIVEDMLQKIK